MRIKVLISISNKLTLILALSLITVFFFLNSVFYVTEEVIKLTSN